MPNITRIVGMHNRVDEANTDKVWAGLVMRHNDGRYQFVALYGPRYGLKREAAQAMTSSFRANQKFDQMLREKRAHGYRVIDWTIGQYMLRGPITERGNVTEATSIMPDGPRRTVEPPATAAVEHMPHLARQSQRQQELQRQRAHDPDPTPTPAPTVEQLTEYLAKRTGRQAEPESPKPTEQPKAPIRKARRLDF